VKNFFCILPALLFSFALSAARPLSEQDIGRILFVSHPDRTAQGASFLVFERVIDKNCIECHRYGSQEKVRIAPDRIIPTGYLEDSAPLYVTQLALYWVLKGREDSPENKPVVKLAKVIGDTSGRAEALRQYEEARRQLSDALEQEYRRGRRKEIDPETCEENIRLLLEDSVLFEMAKKAAEKHDFMLAAMLAQRHFRLAEPKYFSSSEGRQLAETLRRQQQEELLELYRAHVRAGAVRRERFRALCPRARGLWSEAPAVTYKDLLRTVEISKDSFLKLDDLSQDGEFQDWGTAMLNVLLLIENSPAGRELEAEFDRAMAERTPPGTASP